MPIIDKDSELILAKIGYGARTWGSEMGPDHLVNLGLASTLQKAGFNILNTKSINAEIPNSQPTERTKRYSNNVNSFLEDLFESTSKTLEKKLFPVILGGDHSLTIASFAAVSRFYDKQKQDVGIIYIDSHPDINIPGDNPSGAIHGMTVACLLGILGSEDFTNNQYMSLKSNNLFYIGVRDIDQTEQERISNLQIATLTNDNLCQPNLYEKISEIINYFKENKLKLYLSFDLDVLDSSLAMGVNYNPKNTNGINIDIAKTLLKEFLNYPDIVGLDIVEYNPIKDIQNKTARNLIELFTVLEINKLNP